MIQVRNKHSKSTTSDTGQDDPEPIFQECGPSSLFAHCLWFSFAPAQSAHSPAYTLLLRFSLMPSDPTAPEHLSTTHPPTVTVSGPPLPHGPLLSWFCTHSKPSSFCPSACLESPRAKATSFMKPLLSPVRRHLRPPLKSDSTGSPSSR